MALPAAPARRSSPPSPSGGIALRYGGFYGDPDALVKAVRKRQLPAIGDGGGVMSFIHLDDAASPAIYNIVDDEPAPASEWTPALAVALGAKPPRRLPFWLARMVAGESLAMMTEARDASNAKARKELGWTLRYPSWRHGFTAGYSQPESAKATA